MGAPIGARLISKAGSLFSLAKKPASTVQILGAEKALFRALKKGGKLPKHGVIFHSSFISRATAKNKGRISRYLANKAALASRIDFFRDKHTKVYGMKFKQQVEDRLEFFKSGKVPRKNLEVMEEAKKELEAEEGTASNSDGDAGEESAKKKKKYRLRGRSSETAKAHRG
eukprot:TRINITY_DN980_c0_g1_i1.p1 TRINITY_DN980_c0_g1~~TRINITY_DN980_c0_g1_i1.p1  ORF type:complete len:185 (+),score=84.36 TRINITY_DN980_c0_g1_i1:48-557(+)